MAEGTRVTVDKLNNTNYQIWKYKTELLLIKDDLWDVIQAPKPEAPTSAWLKKDGKARAVIGLSVEDSQLVHLKRTTTAVEAWNSLKEYHEKSTLTSKVFMLKKLCKMKLEDSSDMEDHIDKMLTIIDGLTALGETIPDHLSVAFLLCSLPDSYSALTTALESRPEKDLTLDLVKGKLIGEYKRRSEAMSIAQDNSNIALRTDYVAQPRGTNMDYSDRTCFYCKKNGHYKRECRKLMADRRKQGYKNRHKANVATEASASESDGEEQSHVCFGIGKITDSDAWYIDSGATCHMSNNKDFFTSLDYTTDDGILMANGVFAKAKGIGKGKINCMVGNKNVNIDVKEVLYVPELETSLLSVSKLAENGLTVAFDKTKCHIIKDGVTVATARANGQLYKLDGLQVAFSAIENTGSSVCVHVWHRRFGHRDPQAVDILNKKRLVTGMDIKNCHSKITCTDCIRGKMCRKPFPKKSLNRTSKMLELIHTDLCGPMPTATPSGKRYFMTIIDDFSRYSKVYLLNKKDEATLKLQEYIQEAETQFNQKPKIVRSDGGGEYTGAVTKGVLADNGILHQKTAPYSSQQNGVAERKNRSLCEMAKCMLKDAQMENKYWGEAINTANYIQNRMLTKACDQTPYQRWHGKIPDVSNLRIFGAPAYAHIPQERRDKLDDKATKCNLVGYEDGTKAYRLLNMKTNKIIISRDIVFLEDQDKFHTMKTFVEETVCKPDTVSCVETNAKDVVSFHPCESSELKQQESESSESEQQDSEQDLRRSLRKNKGQLPRRYACTVTTPLIMEPDNWKEATMSIEKDKWKKAMEEEINSLQDNHTWDLVDLPPGEKPIGNRWIYKAKYNSCGKVDRYKARLVAQGFTQKYGVHYDEVFAPVVKHTTIRVLLAVAGKMQMTVKHFDIKTAFLNGQLQENLYMLQPQGFEIPGQEKLVCHLKRTIYGLKQSARIWNEKLNNTLLMENFKRGIIDPCVYSRNVNGNWVYILIYVDDLIIASTDDQAINNAKTMLEREFQITDLGDLSYYLGIQVEREGKGIFKLHQSLYITRLLEKFGLKDAKASHIPIDPGYLKQSICETKLPNNEAYRQVIGALLYLAINSRPDIAAAVSILSRKVSEPNKTDWTEAKRILRYLKGTQYLKLKLGKDALVECELKGYADADWGGDPTDRRSLSGYVFKYLGAPISWGCKKQACVALSSTEAEYVSLCEASKEAMWIKRLLEDMHLEEKGCITIFDDSQSCLKLLEAENTSARTKHIDIRFHFVRELVRSGEIKIAYCPTGDMVADIFTKPMLGIKLAKMRNLLGLV